MFCVKQGGNGGQSLGQLCTQPFRNWKHATEKLKAHKANNYHTNCVLNFQHLSAVISKQESVVYEQINKVAKKQKDDNRKIITSVIESVIFCGRQGIALRGHKDYGPLELSESSKNDGNFRALLRIYINATKVSGDNSHVLVRENCKKKMLSILVGTYKTRLSMLVLK